MDIKKILKTLVVAGVCTIIIDQVILAYVNRYFANEAEYKKTEIRTYPILNSSLILGAENSGPGTFSGPMYDLTEQTVGGVVGMKRDKPILSHQQCLAKGSNFNLDSVTYIMCIDTLTTHSYMFPSNDPVHGDMALKFANDTAFTKNKIILQNGNYLMLKGGIPPIKTRQNNDRTKALRVAFGVDGDGNYVFVKYYGTMCELQEYLKLTFGRDNPEYKQTHAKKYERSAFMYLDGNNIVFDGKYYIAKRESFINNNIGLVRLAKLKYVQNAPHINVKRKTR